MGGDSQDSGDRKCLRNQEEGKGAGESGIIGEGFVGESSSL